MPAAEEMARAMGELGVALDAVEAAVEGVVRLTAPPGVAEVLVAPALVRFHARHPRVLQRHGVRRAVNAVPYVCAAPPGIRTTAELPQVIPLFS